MKEKEKVTKNNIGFKKERGFKVFEDLEENDEKIEQILKVEMNIAVPSEYVIVSKIHLEELEKQELSGVYWSMRDVEKRINKKSEWIKENILYPSKFRKILDSENGGFVYYPRRKGENWSFQAVKMSGFLDDNFTKIFSK